MSKKQCRCNVRFYLSKASLLLPVKQQERFKTLAAAWMVMWSEAIY